MVLPLCTNFILTRINNLTKQFCKAKGKQVSLLIRKPVFGVFYQEMLQTGCIDRVLKFEVTRDADETEQIALMNWLNFIIFVCILKNMFSPEGT